MSTTPLATCTLIAGVDTLHLSGHSASLHVGAGYTGTSSTILQFQSAVTALGPGGRYDLKNITDTPSQVHFNHWYAVDVSGDSPSAVSSLVGQYASIGAGYFSCVYDWSYFPAGQAHPYVPTSVALYSPGYGAANKPPTGCNGCNRPPDI